MALRKIVTEEDQNLRMKCREVKEVNDRIRATLLDMLETMRDAYGVGIAAPQVGVMRRMFVAEPNPYYPELDDEEETENAEIPEEKVYFMINPVILEKSETLVEGQEGCLSVPGKAGTVLRSDYIKIKALDFTGEEQVYEFYDWDARVMQHEYDHLDGILYVDRAEEVHNIEDQEEDEE